MDPLEQPDLSPLGAQSAEAVGPQERMTLVPLAFAGHERTYRSWRGRSLKAIQITGLEGVEGIEADDISPYGTIELPIPEADNLRQFFDEHVIHPKNDERYNCHYFGYSIAGWTGAKPPRTRAQGLARVIITGRLNMAYGQSQIHAVENPSALKPGKIYGIGKSDKIVHTLVGLDGPSLSVIGIGKNPDLVIADGSELAEFYGGQMYEITSPSTIPSSVYTPRAELPVSVKR